MKFIPGKLDGTFIIEPDVFADERGFFMESWNYRRYSEQGLDVQFVQNNVSRSSQGVLRGLHFQNPNPQAKLVSVLEGRVFDVAVDLRRSSMSFGQWESVVLDGESKRQFYIPEGFAHGFCVLSDSALFAYQCSSVYDAQADYSIAWNDKRIGIRWPIDNPSISHKDAQGESLDSFDPQKLPE